MTCPVLSRTHNRIESEPMKTDLEIDLKTARLEFRWAHPNLVINPRESDAPGIDVRAVPAERVLLGDSYSSDERWFAFYEEDCFDPPVWIVRADSWETAYEVFCDEALDSVDLEDLDPEQRVAVEGEGNLPDGYSISSDGKLIYTETSMGYEIELISVIF